MSERFADNDYSKKREIKKHDKESSEKRERTPKRSDRKESSERQENKSRRHDIRESSVRKEKKSSRHDERKSSERKEKKPRRHRSHESSDRKERKSRRHNSRETSERRERKSKRSKDRESERREKRSRRHDDRESSERREKRYKRNDRDSNDRHHVKSDKISNTQEIKSETTTQNYNNGVTVKAEMQVEEAGTIKRKKPSRWSTNENEKCVIPGMPTMITTQMNPNDVEAYAIQIELTDVTNKIKKQIYTAEIEAMCRLPSPDPIYNREGKRTNTKEQRARERLEDRRVNLITRLQKIRPDLVPNSDRRSTRLEEKVVIPQDDHPDINFAGLIIGPRGMTQKELEKDTNTRILLRGQGSDKVGKVSNHPQIGQDEPLHAVIIGHSREEVNSAVEKINKIIRDAIEFPELENNLRKNQMKQLAIMNGTYRETEGLNKLKMLTEAQTIVTNTIICSLCGGTGHLPRDCKVALDPYMQQMGNSENNQHLNVEYYSFMNELGPDVKHEVNPVFLGLQEQQAPQQSKPQTSNFLRKYIF